MAEKISVLYISHFFYLLLYFQSLDWLHQLAMVNSAAVHIDV